jgi:photosystem II stability/assembly factor-like uncharacterized protein
MQITQTIREPEMIRIVVTAIAFLIAGMVLSDRVYAGQSWMRIQTPITALVKGIDLPTSSVVVAVGEGGAIARSDDAGLTWRMQTSGVTHDLWAVHFWSADSGLAVGDEGTILTTYDAGATWTPRESGMDKGGARFLFGVTSIGTRLVAVGGEEGSYSSVILTSTDRGATWSKQLLRECIFLDRIAFVDANTAVTVGMVLATGGGGVFRTTDGGASWKEVQEAPQLVTAVDVSGATVVAVGSGGWVYTSTDKGATWESKVELAGIDLLDVAFDGRTNGVIVGDQGGTLLSSDGGRTWTQSSIENGGFLADAAFDPAGSTLFVTGPAGAVYHGLTSASVEQPSTSRFGIRVEGEEIIVDAPGISPVDISIHDILGRTITSTNAVGSARLRVPNAGRYLVVCRDDSRSEVRGVVVVR